MLIELTLGKNFKKWGQILKLLIISPFRDNNYLTEVYVNISTVQYIHIYIYIYFYNCIHNFMYH
jgi:hypothetical protein